MGEQQPPVVQGHQARVAAGVGQVVGVQELAPGLAAVGGPGRPAGPAVGAVTGAGDQAPVGQLGQGVLVGPAGGGAARQAGGLGAGDGGQGRAQVPGVPGVVGQERGRAHRARAVGPGRQGGDDGLDEAARPGAVTQPGPVPGGREDDGSPGPGGAGQADVGDVRPPPGGPAVVGDGVEQAQGPGLGGLPGDSGVGGGTGAEEAGAGGGRRQQVDDAPGAHCEAGVREAGDAGQAGVEPTRWPPEAPAAGAQPQAVGVGQVVGKGPAPAGPVGGAWDGAVVVGQQEAPAGQADQGGYAQAVPLVGAGDVGDAHSGHGPRRVHCAPP